MPRGSSPKSSISANISSSMPISIEMPKLSDTMTEGTLVRWIKKVGDNVAVGDVLAEVETDKATMEMEAFDEGVLAEIYVQDGNKVEVGQKLALLLGKGEKADSTARNPLRKTNRRPRKKRILPRQHHQKKQQRLPRKYRRPRPLRPRRRNRIQSRHLSRMPGAAGLKLLRWQKSGGRNGCRP